MVSSLIAKAKGLRLPAILLTVFLAGLFAFSTFPEKTFAATVSVDDFKCGSSGRAMMPCNKVEEGSLSFSNDSLLGTLLNPGGSSLGQFTFHYEYYGKIDKSRASDPEGYVFRLVGTDLYIILEPHDGKAPTYRTAGTIIDGRYSEECALAGATSCMWLVVGWDDALKKAFDSDALDDLLEKTVDLTQAIVNFTATFGTSKGTFDKMNGTGSCSFMLFAQNSDGTAGARVSGGNLDYSVSVAGLDFNLTGGPAYKFDKASLVKGQKYALGTAFNINSEGEFQCSATNIEGKSLFDWDGFLTGLSADLYAGMITDITFDGSNPFNAGALEINFKNKISESGSVQDAIMGMMNTLLEALQNALQTTAKAVNVVLQMGNDIDNDAVKSMWDVSRNTIMSLLLIAIVLISFANVVQFNIEKYNISRMIPRLFISLILVFISYLYIQVLLAFAGAMQETLVGSFDFNGLATAMQPSSATFGVGDAANSIAQMFLLIFIIIFVFLVLIYLFLILIARIVMIWFLTAIAPLAFGFRILPFTENLYTKWRDNLFKWIFMGPVVVYMLYFTSKIVEAFPETNASAADFSSARAYIVLIMIAVGVFLSATIPVTLGGSLMSKVAGKVKQQMAKPSAAMKKSATKPGGAINRAKIPLGKGRSMSIGKAQYYWDQRGERIKGSQQSALREDYGRRAATGGRLNQILTGVKSPEAQKYYEGVTVKAMAEEMANYNEQKKWDSYANAIAKGDDISAMAALSSLGDSSDLDPGKISQKITDKGLRKKAQEFYENAIDTNDTEGKFNNDVFAKQFDKNPKEFLGYLNEVIMPRLREKKFEAMTEEQRASQGISSANQVVLEKKDLAEGSLGGNAGIQKIYNIWRNKQREQWVGNQIDVMSQLEPELIRGVATNTSQLRELNRAKGDAAVDMGKYLYNNPGHLSTDDMELRREQEALIGMSGENLADRPKVRMPDAGGGGSTPNQSAPTQTGIPEPNQQANQGARPTGGYPGEGPSQQQPPQRGTTPEEVAAEDRRETEDHLNKGGDSTP